MSPFVFFIICWVLFSVLLVGNNHWLFFRIELDQSSLFWFFLFHFYAWSCTKIFEILKPIFNRISVLIEKVHISFAIFFIFSISANIDFFFSPNQYLKKISYLLPYLLLMLFMTISHSREAVILKALPNSSTFMCNKLCKTMEKQQQIAECHQAVWWTNEWQWACIPK